MPAVHSGIVYGDPHIRTLDGRHYTLLKQGIFSLWHLSGLEIEFYSEGEERKCQWIGRLFIHATPHIKPSPRGCYWWTDLEDLRDSFSRSLQKIAGGEPESKVESGQL